MDLYDTSIPVPQFTRRWYKDATLAHDRSAGYHFFKWYSEDINIDPKIVPAIQEDKSWFPFIDYSQFLNILQMCKYKAFLQEGKHWGKWWLDGAGEGIGLGIALTKSKIPYRFVGEYLI